MNAAQLFLICLGLLIWSGICIHAADTGKLFAALITVSGLALLGGTMFLSLLAMIIKCL